jgi:Leucine-rich repeat (LRR) protein
LATLPKPIVKLTSLTKLNLHGSRGHPLLKLTTLPDSIAALTALEGLILDGNLLTTLPDSTAALMALKECGAPGFP